jgi:hypothetical protein
VLADGTLHLQGDGSRRPGERVGVGRQNVSGAAGKLRRQISKEQGILTGVALAAAACFLSSSAV